MNEEQTRQEGAEASAPQGRADTGGSQADEIETLRRELEQARAQAEQHWNEFLRSQAELENVRRRAEREVRNALRHALEGPATDLLAALDSLELGLKSAASEQTSREALIEGMELTLRQLLQALERHGLRRIDPQGERFDPQLHEAVSVVESDKVPPQHVLTVMQPGYALHERLLRPAMVVVARAPAGADGDGGSDSGDTGA